MNKFDRYKARALRVRKGLLHALPRLSVFRSNAHIWAQIIDDKKGNTLVSFSSKTLGKNASQEVAKVVGARLAGLAKEKKIKKVVFDRGAYRYHGKVRALADGAREGGLEF